VQRHNVAYPSRKQKVYYFGGLQFVANRPRELFKPLPDGLEKRVWEQVNVCVHDERQEGGIPPSGSGSMGNGS
jgi:hypothetical protein